MDEERGFSVEVEWNDFSSCFLNNFATDSDYWVAKTPTKTVSARVQKNNNWTPDSLAESEAQASFAFAEKVAVSLARSTDSSISIENDFFATEMNWFLATNNRMW